jgi:hypothetical protein
MDEALKKAGPSFDMLVDGVVRFEDYFFVQGYVVEGTAINSSQIKLSLSEKEYEEWCKTHKIFDPKKL